MADFDYYKLSEKAVRALVELAAHAPGWRSCAHLADAARKACDEEGCKAGDRAEVEVALGVALTRINKQRRAELEAKGLLPPPTTPAPAGESNEA